MDWTETPATNGSDVTTVKRSSLWTLGATVRNPIAALPPEVYRRGIVVTQFFGRPRIYISDPAAIHETLIRNGHALWKGVELQRVLGPALGSGLLTADGAHWRRQRQTMAPAFHHEMLQGLVPAMIAAAEATVARWREAGSGSDIDVGHDMMQTTFKIIVDTMLSGPGRIDAARVGRCVTTYLQSTNWMFALALLKAPDWIPYPGCGRVRAAAAYLRGAIQTHVAARRSSAPQDDLVTLLLSAVNPETGHMMTDEEITDNVLTFMTAGHETTAQGLGWTFLLLAAHPEVEQKILAEVEMITGGDPVGAAHVDRLIYTRQVFSEAMRLYPPVPMLMRTAREDFTLSGLRIKGGSLITIPIYAVHRHHNVWTKPDVFDPDRFAPEQVKIRHRYAFMPFGAGHRICIGSAFAMLEAVAVLAVLVRAAKLERGPDTLPLPTMKVTLRPTVSPTMRLMLRP